METKSNVQDQATQRVKEVSLGAFNLIDLISDEFSPETLVVNKLHRDGVWYPIFELDLCGGNQDGFIPVFKAAIRGHLSQENEANDAANLAGNMGTVKIEYRKHPKGLVYFSGRTAMHKFYGCMSPDEESLLQMLEAEFHGQSVELVTRVE